MSDAIKVGFVPLSSAARGVLVVFCDDGLKLGPATPRGWGRRRRRQAGGHPTSFKGKSGSTLDILAPEGLKATRLIVIGAGKRSASRPTISSNWRRSGGKLSPAPRP